MDPSMTHKIQIKNNHVEKKEMTGNEELSFKRAKCFKGEFFHAKLMPWEVYSEVVTWVFGY